MNLKHQIEVMQAAMDGAAIQWKYKYADSDDWDDAPTPNWNWGEYDYRIKPIVVMIRHYQYGRVVYAAVQNYSPGEDVTTEKLLADSTTVWLDDWQEAKFGPYEPK
jgi:hypothetical protein